jgi:hypothetical protein
MVIPRKTSSDNKRFGAFSISVGILYIFTARNGSQNSTEGLSNRTAFAARCCRRADGFRNVSERQQNKNKLKIT